jgi:regulator of protease activity HflC (stomatin/prohibitin superfamily)
VEFLNKPRTWVAAGAVALGLFLLYQLWVWEIERVEVPPDTFLVKISLWGKDLPDGEIVAPDATYKGVQREVVKEGRDFLNPLLYTYEKHPVLKVPEGQCAVLTRKAGKPISSDRLRKGEFLAQGEFGDPAGERGIIRKPLGPGKYYVNPYLYSFTLEKAVKISGNQVGVRTLRWGNDPPKRQGGKSLYVVPEGCRGVQEKVVPSGTHYFNKHVEDIVPVDISTHQVEFKDIVFFSKDGFVVQPHVRVAYKVDEQKAPELYVMLCDHGKLPQDDATPEQQLRNPILQKFVLPLIRGHVRIEGSKYDARDYVSQQSEVKTSVNPRELLEKELKDKVKPQCEEVGVIVESIAVGQLEMNKDLKKMADLIAERQQARAQREANARLVEQHKQEQKQAKVEGLAVQRQEVVRAKTKLLVQQTDAKKAKEVQEAKLQTELQSAELRLGAAVAKAQKLLTDGKADADVIMAQNEAQVAGLKTKVGGFASPEQFAHYQVLTKLSPALSEIFASDTSEFARVFSTYMLPGKKPAAGALQARKGDPAGEGRGGK